MARRKQPSVASVFTVDEAALAAVRAALLDDDGRAGADAARRIASGRAQPGDALALARLFERPSLGEVALQLVRACGFWNADAMVPLSTVERIALMRAVADCSGVNDVVRAAAKVRLSELGDDGRDAVLARIDGLGPWLELALRVDVDEARAIVAPRLADRFDAWRVAGTELAAAPWMVDEALRVLQQSPVSTVALLIANRSSERAREELLALLAPERLDELAARWPTDGAQPFLDEELARRAHQARGDVFAAFDAFLARLGRPGGRGRRRPAHVVG